jgi:hypothetical protein
MHAASVIASAMFSPKPMLYAPPQGGKALCCRDVFALLRRPCLLCDALRVVGKRPGKGGVLLVQTLLSITNPNVSGSSMPARLASMTHSTVVVSRTAAVDGFPRQASLPSNYIILCKARISRGCA